MPLSPQHRKAISQGQIARHKKAREMVVAEPTHKRCTQCGEVKSLSAFSMRKRTLASGEVKEYPAGECKKCGAKRAAAYKDKLRKEGRLKEKQREWDSRRDPEQVRECNRLYQAEQRRKKGIPVRGPWKKYRRNTRTDLPSEPLAAFVEEQMHRHGRAAVAVATGVHPEQLDRLRRRDLPSVTLDLADRILVGLGLPDQLAVLYPQED